MFKIKNIVLALVFSYLMLLAVPQMSASSAQFDNTDFESQLTSEEIAEKELMEKEEDYNTYMETVELKGGYKNFAGLKLYEDQETFDIALQSTYDTMKESSEYTENQKNDYYNLVIGTEQSPGVMRQMFDLSELVKSYNENEAVTIDGSGALQVISQYGYPQPNIDNVEYLKMLSQELNDIRASLVEVDNNTASTDEILNAQESNVILTNELNTIYRQFEYYSLPKTPILNRLLNTSVIMNIAMLVATLVLFLIRFPIVKKQQEYAWNGFKPLTLLIIPLVSLIFFLFFSWFFNPKHTVETQMLVYNTYLDGVKVSQTDRIYLNETGTHKLTLVAPGNELNVSAASYYITISDDPNVANVVQDIPKWKYGEFGTAEFESNNIYNIVYPYSEDKFQYIRIKDIIGDLEIEYIDNYESDETALDILINNYRNEFILPMSLRLISPALLFGTLYFMFMLMPKPMVKAYLNELYTINKFCGFLSYNMAYRSNARVLIEETLQSLDSCKFAEDFAIIFFEKDRNMTDKIQDISQIYSYKFFEMYLGIVNIIFDEGVSDSTLKSLSIIQQFGDEYYNQADMFFKSKNGALSSLLMIIAICVAIPVIVKVNAGLMFTYYTNTANGYTATIGSYLIWFGLVCLIHNMYKDNKIVRAEGRYA